MAGHSKWANIKHKKAATDARRGKLWTKLIREITVAARTSGPDPSSNPRLRLAMDKASEANLPKDTVLRAIQRGAGNQDDTQYEEIRYEGYGPAGVAVIVDCLTDNRTRTVAEVRHAFNKHGGNLGQDGSVAYLFSHCGQCLFAPGTASEDQVMAIALEAGADDVQVDAEGGIEVTCSPQQFAALRDAFLGAGLTPALASLAMKPANVIALEGDDAQTLQTLQTLLDVLEGLDDVQEVHTNAALDV